MTPYPRKSTSTPELEEFLVSLTASRARLEQLACGVGVPDLGDLVEEVDVLTEQLLAADAELRAQQSQLAEAGRRAEQDAGKWQLMFARSVSAYYLTGADGVITNSNLAARQLLDEPESMPTQLRPITSKFALDDRPAIREALRRAVTDGEPGAMRCETHVRPGGTPRLVDVSVTPVHAPGEEVTLWRQLVAAGEGPADSSDIAALEAGFTRVAEAMQGVEDPQHVLRRIVEIIPEHLPSVEYVGISAFRRGQLSTLAASDSIAEQVDALQYRSGQGPCLEAMLTQRSYRTGDLGVDDRWPKFGELCVQNTPVRSVMAFRLPIDDHAVAALNCYSSAYDAFAADSVNRMGAIFAAHTALALATLQGQEQAANLNMALSSSRLIGAAIGILMAHHRVTQDQAFDLLRQTSQRKHRKLRDVADDVVHTGDIG